MGTVYVRIPDELEAELAAYVEEEGLDRSTAIRMLLRRGSTSGGESGRWSSCEPGK